ERARGDRTLGQARAQLGPVHAHDAYDLEVDTARLDPAAADVIRRALAERPRDQESVLACFR
ncbi:MAG: chloramphenicol phosphotransferase CPT family protein, partial [Chloroflexota bacterium]|nr:chloramphenicol phosphotransferase CPT family protein [Chloroflexota bacterium]